MDYVYSTLGYIYDTIDYIYDTIYYSGSPLITYDQFENNFQSNNFQTNNKDEIDKLIKEVENEIRIDKEIKIMQLRYDNLCNSFDIDNNTDENQSNNYGALSVKKEKKIKIKN